jgi:hypothetical protein
VQDSLSKQEPEIGDASDIANQIAVLLSNSVLLRSYETMMQEYEDSLA